MKKYEWPQYFSPTSVPSYPCPHCGIGRVHLYGAIEKDRPKYSEARIGKEDFHPTDLIERFSFSMRCNHRQCGEIVNVIGAAGLDYDIDEEGEQKLEEYLAPKAFYPAPPMIVLPLITPLEVTRVMTQAFQVCWADPGSAANRIRVAVELALDALHVPRSITSKAGDLVDLDLNGRIKHLEEKMDTGADHGQTFHALRRAGNVGSHSAQDVKWNDFLDCLLVFEKALDDLFGSKKFEFEKAIKNLMELGKPKTKKISS